MARNAADEIEFAKREVLNAVRKARANGFVVDEDLGVVEKYASSTPVERAARAAQAQRFAVEIRTKATALVTVDGKLSSRLVAATTAVANLTFDQVPARQLRDDLVQAVDFSEAPPPPEPPAPPPRPRGLPPEGIEPPVPGALSPGPASRPSEAGKGGRSLWDEGGGEWRYFPGNTFHHPHWDFNPHETPNSPWENVPIGGLPPVKDDPAITGLPPWLKSPATPDSAGPPQNPMFATFPGINMPNPSSSTSLPSPRSDWLPSVDVDVPNPQDLENAGDSGTAVVTGAGLLALLYMVLAQN